MRFDATLPRSEIASLGRLRDAPRRCFIAETHTTAGNREHNTRALPTCSGLNVPNVKLGALSSPPPWGLVAGTRGGGTAPALGFMVLLFGVGPRCERDCEPGMGRVRQGGAGGGGGDKRHRRAGATRTVAVLLAIGKMKWRHRRRPMPMPCVVGFRRKP